MFDEKTRQELKYYVYMLLDPRDNYPFYVGKGIGNRVFDHLDCALTDLDMTTAKYDRIREILQNGKKVKHVIVRHGLTEDESFQIESSLIDSLTYCGIMLSNLVSGHNSIEKGLMTSEEIKRLYNAETLNSIAKDCLIININKSFKKSSGKNAIYEATKQTWKISEKRRQQTQYVLSEYRGFIVEVFKVDHWYEKERGYNPRAKKYGQTYIGYGFNGSVAEDSIRDVYINKTISQHKKRGFACVLIFPSTLEKLVNK